MIPVTIFSSALAIDIVRLTHFQHYYLTAVFIFTDYLNSLPSNLQRNEYANLHNMLLNKFLFENFLILELKKRIKYLVLFFDTTLN